jgi:hypothetical protein
MQIIKLEIENSIYIVNSGIDIQKKFNEFLKEFAIIKPLSKLGTGALAPAFSEAKAITSNKFCKKSIDDYPIIGTDEVKGICLNENEYNSSINRFMIKLEQKYADN